MFDHLADPDPPAAVEGARARIAQRLRRRRRQRLSGAVIGVLAVTTAVAVVIGTTSSGSGSRVVVDGTPTANGARPSPDTSLLTLVSTRPQVTERTIAHRRFRLVDYRGLELQERSLRNGGVEAVLLRTSSRDQVSASFLPNGDVLVGLSDAPACGATLLSVDPSNGSTRTIAHLPGSILGLGGLTVSPDGKSVAYVAYPGCQEGAPVPTTLVPAGSARPSASDQSGASDYLAIRNLDTAVTRRIPIREEGDTFDNDGPVWSPNGRQLAFASFLSTSVFSVTDAGLTEAAIVHAPARCLIDAIGAWTAAGITESLQCSAPVVGRYDPRHPPASWNLLEQVMPSGRTSNRLRLSTCDGIDDIGSSLPGSVPVVDAVNTPIALGSVNSCHAPTTQIATFAGGRLHTVVTATSEIDLPG